MRLGILIIILFLYVTPFYSQEGSKIDLRNVNVASERIPTIFLFGDEFTIRGRKEFLEGLLKSHFYRPDLKIVINLQEFISGREFSFRHNGAVRINIDSKKLKNLNRYNNSVQSSFYINNFLRNVKSVRIDSSLTGILERRALKNEINMIQKQIDSLNIDIRNDSINIELNDSKNFKKLYRKQKQRIRKLENISVLEISIFTD